MPDPRRLLRATGLALLPGIAAAQDDCTPRLTVTAADATAGLQATYTAICAPYAPVTVALGPLVFGEQTGQTGELQLDLPKLVDGRMLSITLDGSVSRAILPAAAAPVPPLAAVSWPDAPLPDLPGAWSAESGLGTAPLRLGFPGETPVVDLLPAGTDHLDLPVTAATCGRSVAAQVIIGETMRDLRVTLPDCGGPDGTLRLPLAP